MRRYDVAKSGTSEESRLVDAAQIEILRYAKYSAEQMLDVKAFLKGVERIIKVLTDKLTSEALIVRCRAILPTYAVRMYYREQQLVRTYALWYAFALESSLISMVRTALQE